jgi:hypothetical protein
VRFAKVKRNHSKEFLHRSVKENASKSGSSVHLLT